MRCRGALRKIPLPNTAPGSLQSVASVAVCHKGGTRCGGLDGEQRLSGREAALWQACCIPSLMRQCGRLHIHKAITLHRLHEDMEVGVDTGARTAHAG